jgi:hypothetical protein
VQWDRSATVVAMGASRYNPRMSRASRPRRRRRPLPATPRSAAARLALAESLFRDFARLTPYRFRPFVKSFASFDEYERWRRAQTNPWYR